MHGHQKLQQKSDKKKLPDDIEDTIKAKKKDTGDERNIESTMHGHQKLEKKQDTGDERNIESTMHGHQKLEKKQDTGDERNIESTMHGH